MAEIRIVSYLSGYDCACEPFHHCKKHYRDVVLHAGKPVGYCCALSICFICLLMPKHDLDLMFPIVSIV